MKASSDGWLGVGATSLTGKRDLDDDIARFRMKIGQTRAPPSSSPVYPVACQWWRPS